MIDTSVKTIQLDRLSEGHLFKHGAYIFAKCTLDNDCGGIRSSKSCNTWVNIPESTSVIPLVVGMIKDAES